METYRYKDDLIIGFDKLRIDKESTKRKVAKTLDESELKKEFLSTHEEFKAIPPAANRQDVSRHSKQISPYIKKLNKLHRRLNNEAKHLYKNNHVFFHLRKNERTCDNIDELKTKFKNLKPNQSLLTSGEIIDNFKGTIYHVKINGKLKRRKIKKLGETVPADAIELTPELEFEMKLDNMDKSEIGHMKAGDVYAAKHQAVYKKSELEFDGMDTPAAIIQSKEGYNSDVKIIDEKYKKWLG